MLNIHRAGSPVLLGLLLVATVALAQDTPRGEDTPQEKVQGGEVFTFADGLVGGASALSLDVMRNVYAANFGEHVYKIRPNGESEVFASGLYGTTGNAIDSLGILYQANFFGGFVTKIDRRGNQELFATGLQGPMALAFGADGDLFVANCSSQSITAVAPSGEVRTFVQGPLFKCPNGITLASDGNFYVVNFDDEALIRVTPEGDATKFATLPHSRNTIASARGHLYVASLYRKVFRVSLVTGEVTHIAGTGERENRDGPALEASFSRPNGIAVTPDGAKVFVSNIVRGGPARAPQFEAPDGLVVRVITLPSLTDRLTDASHGGEHLDLDALAAEYYRLRENPATAGLLDEAEMIGFAQEIQIGAPEAAVKVLELNAESYPRSWRALEALARLYVQVGDEDKALEALEKSLALNPANRQAAQLLEDLRGGTR